MSGASSFKVLSDTNSKKPDCSSVIFAVLVYMMIIALSSRFKSVLDLILKSFPKLSDSRGRGNCRSWGKKVKKYTFLLLVVVNIHTGKANVLEDIEDGLSEYFDYTLTCWKEALNEFVVDVIDPVSWKVSMIYAF